MEISCDVNKLRNSILPTVMKSQQDLRDARKELIGISTPSNFPYASYLFGLSSKIAQIENEMSSIGSWVLSVADKFDKVEITNRNIADMLGVGKSNKKNTSPRKNKSNSENANKTKGKSTKKGSNKSKEKKNNSSSKNIKGKSVKSIKLTGKKSNKNIIYTGTLKSNVKNNEIINKDGIKPLFSNNQTLNNKTVNTSNLQALEKFVQTTTSSIKDTGAQISQKFETVCNDIKDICDEIKDTLAPIVADVMNVILALLRGILKFLESLVDLVIILGTAVGSIGTGVYDLITYLNKGDEEWNSVTAEMWKETMSVVSTDCVGMISNEFYQNTELGKWLDENAHDPFKSTGIVSEIAEGIGYVAGIILLTIATGGAGSVTVVGSSSTTTAAIFAGLAGTGKATEEYWAAARDSYEGEGDWQTFEVWAKGLGYGAVNGAWEAGQWYVGGELFNWTKGIANATNAKVIRVAADTALNASDTPFRSFVDAVFTDKSFEESWEERGGYVSMVADGVIGFIGSGIGEIAGKAKNGVEIDSKTTKVKGGIEITSKTRQILENNVNMKDGTIDVTDELLDELRKDTKLDSKVIELLEKVKGTKINGKEVKIAYNSETFADLTPVWFDEKNNCYTTDWESYAPNGGAVEGSLEYVEKMGDDGARYGAETGYFMGRQEDSYVSKSIPEHESIKMNSYHKYDTSKVNATAVNEKYKIATPEKKIEILKDMARNASLTDNELADILCKEGLTHDMLEEILENYKSKKITSKEIAEMFPEINFKIKKSIAAPTINRPGGATQYELPISVKTLIELELIKEIK